MVNFPGHNFDGQTLIEDDERIGLLLDIDLRGELNSAEAENIERGLRKYLNPKRRLTLDALLKESFAKRLHKECFGDVWDWAGKYRKVATRPGIDWHQISPQMNQLMMNTKTQIDFLYEDPEVNKLEALVANFAYRLVHIHPFRNGNGRWSRAYADLLSDLLLIERFTWGQSIENENIRQNEMINALQAADFSGSIEQFINWAKS